MKPSSATLSNAPYDANGRERPSGRSFTITVALSLIRGYQLVISPIFTGSCRFLPSCSQYAAEAIARRGVLAGGWLAAKRLARCHPFCEGGHDPVPPRS